MATQKEIYIAVALALAVVLVFVLLGFFGFRFGIGSGGGNQGSPDALLEELSRTGAVSELQVYTLAEGSGSLSKNGDTLSVHYIGVLPDGTVFDSSRERGAPFTFTLGEGLVIRGWEEGLVNRRAGDRLLIAIPPEMGYGSRAVGNIPPNATLIFDVEVIDILAGGE